MPFSPEVGEARVWQTALEIGYKQEKHQEEDISHLSLKFSAK